MSELSEVRQAVERGLPAAVDFLRALVQEPSTVGNEEGAQALVEERLLELGFDVRSIEPDADALAERPESGLPLLPYAGRRCLVGMLGEGSRSLLLNGHVDIVSAEPLDRWRHDPFGAEIEGDRLYGRGACDMKGGIAAMLLAVEAARALEQLPVRLVYQSVIEEECTGNGALAACLAGPTADATIIAEPTNCGMDLVAVGVVWARITFEGVLWHASQADQAPNAIEEAFRAIAALRELEEELNAEPEPEFEGIARPYLLNVGALHAGDWPSSAPGRAVLDVRLGFPIRMDPIEAQRRLAEAVRRAEPEANVEFRGMRARGYAFPADTELVELVSACHEELHGERPLPEPSRATTDLRFFEGQAVCYGPTGDSLHGVDEWVDIPSIADVATVLALLIRRWGS